MRLLEIMNITYDMEFIIFKNSKCYLQRHFETYPIISNITTHCLNTHYKYLWKSKIFANNKSPWGMKTHDNKYCWCPFCRMNTTQPKGTNPHEQAQSKKNSNKRQRTENRQSTLVHPWLKYNWRPPQENQVFMDGLGAIPSTFCHLLPDVNSAQRLWY